LPTQPPLVGNETLIASFNGTSAPILDYPLPYGYMMPKMERYMSLKTYPKIKKGKVKRKVLPFSFIYSEERAILHI
jgi:hypothetical protein